jgi:hypothetical protein
MRLYVFADAPADAADAVREELAVPPDVDFDFSVWPGAIDETSAAKPADSAAAPAIIHRLVRETRRTAASRSSAASDGLRVAAP